MRVTPFSTLPRRALISLRIRVRHARERLATRGFRRDVARVGAGTEVEYRAYLDEQARRSVGRRGNDPGIGQRLLVAAAASAVDTAASVLCVGCRNGLELDTFRAHGLTDVRGIDIFSQRADILVMDMHRMTFPDDSFDVVYSSHSLEHAFDLDRVVSELIRVGRDGAVVALEVPVAHRGSDADLVVFTGIEMLERLFEGRLGDVLLREEEPAFSSRNDQGSTVARLVFRLQKAVAHP